MKLFWGLIDINISEKVKDKILSGRFIFTVVSAIVFAYLSIKKILPIDKVTEILLIVIYAYFNRSDRRQENRKEI
jgi:hypothetical protein